MPELAVSLLVFLFMAAFLAGFVDAIAGGGGLITVPAMLLAGVPPLETLGTNKLQSLFGSGSATLAYARGGYIDWQSQMPMAVLAALGAGVGAAITTYIPGEALKALMPFLLIGIALYFGLKPQISGDVRHAKMRPFVFGVTMVPLIGFYDGVFGPGTGSFLMLAFVMLAGFGLLKATAHTKMLNFASNIGAFAIFAFVGAVIWKIGLIMGVGQFLGAQAGSKLAMKNGAAIIRPLLITICIALAIRLLADSSNPVRVALGF